MFHGARLFQTYLNRHCYLEQGEHRGVCISLWVVPPNQPLHQSLQTTEQGYAIIPSFPNQETSERT